ncbi:hypothetical protein FXO38_28763 [Capsicum annuum]|nr:hypothetical protein FXO38_28763 [Capsicum annuum]
MAVDPDKTRDPILLPQKSIVRTSSVRKKTGLVGADDRIKVGLKFACNDLLLGIIETYGSEVPKIGDITEFENEIEEGSVNILVYFTRMEGFNAEIDNMSPQNILVFLVEGGGIPSRTGAFLGFKKKTTLLISLIERRDSRPSCPHDHNSSRVFGGWELDEIAELKNASHGFVILHASFQESNKGRQKMKMAPDHMSTSVCLEIEKMYLCLANILLDDDCEAVVGEFGLAKLLDHRHSHDTTAVRGTVGHIAPEYLSTGQSSDKTDVFGFGILLLELISGQRALEFGKEANQKGAMLDWVKKIHQEKKLDMLVSKDLRDKYDRIDLEEMVQVALICYDALYFKVGQRVGLSKLGREI